MKYIVSYQYHPNHPTAAGYYILAVPLAFNAAIDVIAAQVGEKRENLRSLTETVNGQPTLIWKDRGPATQELEIPAHSVTYRLTTITEPN
jgi:hypothetical protein